MLSRIADLSIRRGQSASTINNAMGDLYVGQPARTRGGLHGIREGGSSLGHDSHSVHAMIAGLCIGLLIQYCELCGACSMCSEYPNGGNVVQGLRNERIDIEHMFWSAIPWLLLPRMNGFTQYECAAALSPWGVEGDPHRL